MDQSHADYKEYSEGRGYAFVKGFDAFDAAEKLKKELKQYRYKSVVAEFIKEYDFVLWEETESYEYMNSLVEKARETNEVIFSTMFGVKREIELKNETEVIQLN